MSWGSTGWTPIVTNNQPPFGFSEVITPHDFKTNATNPWASTEELKAELNARFTELDKRREKAEQQQIEAFGSNCYTPFSSSLIWILLLVILGGAVLYLK